MSIGKNTKFCNLLRNNYIWILEIKVIYTAKFKLFMNSSWIIHFVNCLQCRDLSPLIRRHSALNQLLIAPPWFPLGHLSPTTLCYRFFSCLHFCQSISDILQVKKVVLWDVAPCRYCINLHFGGMYRLHFQGRKIKKKNPRTRIQREQMLAESANHIPEDGFLHSHCRENLKSYILQMPSNSGYCNLFIFVSPETFCVLLQLYASAHISSVGLRFV
jgi:hypothetical protein